MPASPPDTSPPADHTAAVIPFESHSREAKRATDDGYIWPRPRSKMGIGLHIRQRMAEDMETILRRAPRGRVIVTDDLLKLGWTALQIDAHREAATALVDPTANDPVEQNPEVA